jgi:peptidoglycan/xylan/chitin deacetylase (PgdA/CDA1 family)
MTVVKWALSPAAAGSLLRNSIPEYMKDPRYGSFRWPDGQRGAVSLCWDDARPSSVEVGVPILDHYGIKGTFYALPRNMTRQLKKWRAAAAEGHEIGNHTIKHPCMGNFISWQTPETMLENYTLDRMKREILEANRVLEAAVGVKPTSFAYPCAQTYVGRGTRLRSYIPLVARLFEVGRSGFSETYASPERCDLAQVPSLDIDCKTFEQLRALVGAAMADGCWLVLTGHEVGDGCVKQTTSAKALEKLCAYLKGRPDIWTDTVTAVGRHIAALVKHPPIPARLR